MAAAPGFPLAPGAPAGVDSADPQVQAGCLNVTKAPYNADPTGARDSTEAIQRAVDDAREFQYVCFFPSGTYLISDTISCEQKVYKLDKPRKTEGKTQTYWGDRDRPCILMGSTQGKRPLIRLAPDISNFDNPEKPKPAIWIWAQTRNNAPGKDEPVWGKEQANISFNQIFRGIDIDVSGHAGAIGIRHTGSQGSTLEDVTIHAEGAFAGLGNCPGQGGGTYGVTVHGGRYGLYATQECRYPMLAACEFKGQTVAAVWYGSQGIPMLLVGCSIQKEGGPAVDLTGGKGPAGLGIIDSVISISGGGDIVAASNPKTLVLENVFVSGAARVRANGATLLAANGWTTIQRYVSCAPGSTNCLNGTQTSGEIAEWAPAASPPSYDAIRKKHLWKETPSFEDADAVNVKSLGAVGDGVADDTAALKRALAAHDEVFLPRGTYRVSEPLVL
ncbi:MAG: glycosyl hydrolase family 28-related protein, partial [Candidatus Sumerlaeota bacterium]|nr:glycosyl hydrolase family 28-related protein [Candidatus Sumerlaeota bacterium]